jgi:hypothetical protein
MMRAYERLLRSYPDDTRFAYGSEFLTDFELGMRGCQRKKPTESALVRYAPNRRPRRRCGHGSYQCALLASLLSRPGRPNPGVVRQPNMGKKEWFDPPE